MERQLYVHLKCRRCHDLEWISAPVLSCTPDIYCWRKPAAGNGVRFISQCLYEKHSIICPAVHTVAKRMRLIVSGLMKLSSSFIFRAQVSAFSICPKQAFSGLSNLPNGTFQSARNYYPCQNMIFRENHKVPTPSFPISFAWLSRPEIPFAIFSQTFDLWPCLLFNVALEQVQRGRAQHCPELTRWRAKASSSHATWPTLTTSFLLAKRHRPGVWGGVNRDCLAMLAPSPKSSAVIWLKLCAASRQLVLLMGKSY